MSCNPDVIACQIALLRADLGQSWLESALTVFVWPLLAVLIPILIAIFVSRHGRRATLEAVERQIAEAAEAAAAIERQRIKERREDSAKATADSQRRYMLDLLAEVLSRIAAPNNASSDQIMSDIVSVRKLATLLSVNLPREAKHTLAWLDALPSRYSKVRWKMANGAPLSAEWHAAVLADAETFLRGAVQGINEPVAIFANLNNRSLDKVYESGRKPTTDDLATPAQAQAVIDREAKTHTPK